MFLSGTVRRLMTQDYPHCMSQLPVPRTSPQDTPEGLTLSHPAVHVQTTRPRGQRDKPGQDRCSAANGGVSWPGLAVHWLQVVDATETPHIDQGVHHRFHPIVALLDVLETE